MRRTLHYKFALLKGQIAIKTKSLEKKLSLLAGKLSMEKKVYAFEWCSVLIQKHTKSFGGKNLAPCLRFSPIKSQVYFLF